MKNTLRSTVTLHDGLHGFRKGRGTGTANMEENQAQQHVGIVREPLFKVFIDVHNSYDSFNKGICMEILSGYGPEPNI